MKLKIFVVTLFMGVLTTSLIAQETTVPTFECISAYWSPEGGAADKNVLVRFKETGATQWETGLEIRYNPLDNDSEADTQKGGDYRGSIVNLTPNTEYEIELTLEGTSTTITYTEKTWSENFPIGKTIYPGKLSKQLTLYSTASGTADGYVLYDGQGDTIDVNNIDDACINIKGNYIIIRNYVLTGGKKYGIFLEDDIHDVVIENCDISNWGEILEDGWGTQQGAIQATKYGSFNACCDFKDITRIVVQRNKIHHPRSDANSWAEGRYFDGNTEPNYHPIGPQAVMFMNSAGNHVIRYNEVWSDADHYYNDILGYEGNQTVRGFPGPDSDIYGNYLANCWDEPIEVEGGGRNVRVWGNYVEEGYLPIAAASTRLGPLYVWRNVSGRTDTPEGSKHGDIQPFFKQEYYEEGFKYLFNNTILQPNDHGAGGLATEPRSSTGSMENFITRNNILHVRSRVPKSILTDTPKGFCDFDYDLCSGTYPSGHEVSGISGTPTYTGTGFDKTTMTGDFSLSNGTSGHDDGAVVPNFIEDYEGIAPDMGASEVDGDALEYGVNAYKCNDLVALTSSATNGQVYPPAGNYCNGSVVQFTATADVGYEFDSWAGDFSGTENPKTITVDADLHLEANFTPLPVYTLNTDIVGRGSVSVSGNKDYFEGDKVKVTAFPKFQESFLRWEGDTSGTDNPIYLTINSDVNLVAVFSGVSGISEIENGHNKYGLVNYPNPFSEELVIEYELFKTDKVYISIHNSIGQEVLVLMDAVQKTGKHFLKWNGADSKSDTVSNGVYFNKIVVGDNEAFVQTVIFNK